MSRGGTRELWDEADKLFYMIKNVERLVKELKEQLNDSPYSEAKKILEDDNED